MKPQFAVIDVGSNSVRLMLGVEESGRARSLTKTLCSTRLASGIDRTGELMEDRIAATVEAIDAYRNAIEPYRIPVLCYATSAVRDANNRDVFLKRVLERTGIEVLVLSGEAEGNYAFSAVTCGEGTVFDIGGGSFQVVTKERSLSVPCGCVRAKAICDASDPKILERELFAWIDAKARIPEAVYEPVYGVGGTITCIGALLAGQTQYDGAHLQEITLPRLQNLLVTLSTMTEAERLAHPLMTQKRGDIILQGCTILRWQMLHTHTDRVIPSDRDGMEGIAEALLIGSGNASIKRRK